MKQILLMMATCVSLSVVVAAEVGPPTNLPVAARGAGRIVVAKVADVHARFASNKFGDQLIVSSARLEVVETLKGAPTTQVALEIEGGTVGDLTLRVSDLPLLQTGDRAVFFLDASGDGPMAPHGRGRGILRLLADDRVEGADLNLTEVRRQVRAALAQGAR